MTRQQIDTFYITHSPSDHPVGLMRENASKMQQTLWKITFTTYMHSTEWQMEIVKKFIWFTDHIVTRRSTCSLLQTEIDGWFSFGEIHWPQKVWMGAPLFWLVGCPSWWHGKKDEPETEQINKTKVFQSTDSQLLSKNSLRRRIIGAVGFPIPDLDWPCIIYPATNPGLRVAFQKLRENRSISNSTVHLDYLLELHSCQVLCTSQCDT